MSEILIAGLLLFGLASGAQGALQVGDAAPDFKLEDQDGKLHSLKDYAGQKVVVYFYPKDDTPGCTSEACSIRDDYGLFEKHEIMVFGISYDDAESHRKFREKHDLPFTLLSDSDKSVSAAYDSKGMMFAKRKTFLINEQGKLIKIYENVDVSTHGADILADFAAKEGAQP